MADKQLITSTLLGPEVDPATQKYKNKFFEYLGIPPDDYSDLYFTREEMVAIKRKLQNLSTGSSAAIPLICGAKQCPFYNRCPIARVDEERKLLDPHAKSALGVGKACLVELNLLNEWTRLYLEEYQVGEDSFTELQMVRELAEIEVMLWRLNNNLALPENAALVQEEVVGIDKHGNKLTRTAISSTFEAKERLQIRKSRLIKNMVGDRQEKYKEKAALKTRDSGDPSIIAAQLRREMLKQMDAIKQSALAAPAPVSHQLSSPDDIIAAEIEKQQQQGE